MSSIGAATHPDPPTDPASGPALSLEPAPQVSFPRRWHGYDPYQVDRHVVALEEALATTATRAEEAERRADAAWERVRQLEGDIDHLNRRLGEAPPSAADVGERVAGILALAADEAAELRRQADEEATGLRETAAAELTAARAEIERNRQRFASESREAADRHRVQLDRERMEALAEIDDERRAVRRQGQQLVADARAEAHRLTDAAQAQVRALETHRDDLLARLGALRDELTRLLGDAVDAGDGRDGDAPVVPPG